MEEAERLTRLPLPRNHRYGTTLRPQREKDGRELELCSMGQDSPTFRPWLAEFALAEAIERGVLAGFEIDVLEIEDPDYFVGLSDQARRGRRLALLQAALLEHASARNIKTMMTFHSRVEEPEAFALNLPQTGFSIRTARSRSGYCSA
ncbi:hypothetical protein ACFQ9Z_34215 [Streptomyces sp. NPDC056580]|uniref:hypothetical protein n=1 Tax=Streptomyces sp. NPDC056580 TaxID=3345872 RepID=UPI003690011D